MTIKQKPLSRRKSFKYFTPSIPDNVDDFWEVAKDGEIDNELKDDTLEFPESSAINDSSLKFKKEFSIAEAPQDDFIILSEKNESVSEELGDQSLMNELTNKKLANQNLISEGNQNSSNKPNDEDLSNKPNKEELNNKQINEDLSKKGSKLTNQNDILNYDIASNNFSFTSEKEKMKKQSLKKNKKPILKDNTNLSKKKSFLPVKKPNSQINSTIQNSSPNKLNLVRRSSIIKSKSNEILAIIDSKRFITNLNCHTKLKKINKTEVALVNLSINSKIKDQSCNRNMIITIIKGSIKVDYNDNSFILKAGGICFVEKETVYSIIGNSSNGSVFQIVYVR